MSFVVSQLDGEKERELKRLLSLDRQDSAENIGKSSSMFNMCALI